MDASKWNCQIIHCLNALASLSSPLQPYPSQAPLTHFNPPFPPFLISSPPRGSPAREEHLRNQKCRHIHGTLTPADPGEGDVVGGGGVDGEQGRTGKTAVFSARAPDISSNCVCRSRRLCFNQQVFGGTAF